MFSRLITAELMQVNTNDHLCTDKKYGVKEKPLVFVIDNRKGHCGFRILILPDLMEFI